MNKEALEKLSQARTQLIIRFRFFGYLALTFRFVESQSAGGAGTLCVDANNNIYYNPEFINSLNLIQVTAVLCHEILHVVQSCHARFPVNGDMGLWNLASDLVVNSMLLDTDEKALGPLEKLGKPLAELSGFSPEVYRYAKGKTTEEIYLDLLKENKKLPQFKKCGREFKENKEGDPGPTAQKHDHRNGLGCSSGSLFGKEISKSQVKMREWTEKIMTAAQAAKDQSNGQGNLPGWLSEFFTKLTQPTVTWKDYLRRSSLAVFKGRYSWNRPSRRSESIGMRLQVKKPTPKAAVITIDSSGSISDTMLNKFASESVGIIKACGASAVWIYFHDVNCYYKGLFTKEALKKISVQRGGTSHIPVFEEIKKDKRDIGLIVCFTDLMSSFPAPQDRPKCPVIWAVPSEYKDAKHPWGDKLVVKMDED